MLPQKMQETITLAKDLGINVIYSEELVDPRFAEVIAQEKGPEWVNAFLQEFRELFGDMVLNLTVNSMLDGNAIHKNQQHFMLKKVGVFA